MNFRLQFSSSVWVLIAAGLLLGNCTFDTSGVVSGPSKDPRFDGCWENTEVHEIWGRVIFDIQQKRGNLLTGFLFVRAESLATIIPYALEGEVQGFGIADFQASLHANPDISVLVVGLLSGPPQNDLTFQMAGKPPPPLLSVCD